MSDQIASTPLHGPTTYDFGEATPKEWPQGEYVPKSVYDILAASVDRLTSDKARLAVDYANTVQANAEVANINCDLNERLRALEAAARQLLSLVANKGQPMSHPDNQALYAAGDTITVNEGNLWNLQMVLGSVPETPADYTIDGDGVWMGGKWHPKGAPKSETFAKPKQFAPIGDGTICSNCTKTIGYHYQTAEGHLFCEVPKP